MCAIANTTTPPRNCGQGLVCWTQQHYKETYRHSFVTRQVTHVRGMYLARQLTVAPFKVTFCDKKWFRILAVVTNCQQQTKTTFSVRRAPRGTTVGHLEDPPRSGLLATMAPAKSRQLRGVEDVRFCGGSIFMAT